MVCSEETYMDLALARFWAKPRPRLEQGAFGGEQRAATPWDETRVWPAEVSSAISPGEYNADMCVGLASVYLVSSLRLFVRQLLSQCLLWM